MENGVEALKIAFAIMMLIMALSLSISSFSKVSEAVTAIVNLNDRETEYNYVVPQSDRIVSAETIVPIMYKAYKENFEVRFYDRNGDPVGIYYATDSNGNKKQDQNSSYIEVSVIDGTEVFGSAEEAQSHLDQILGGKTYSLIESKYAEQIKYIDGFYEGWLKGRQFKEEIGEYYQNDSASTPEANKTKKRIITYTELIP